MEESTAYMISDILVGAYGGTGVSGTQIAGKTGTTNLNSDTKKKYGLPGGAVMDAWIVSYSPSYSIALWYGYDELTKDSAENKYYLTSGTGGTARRRIMNSLASRIHKKNGKFSSPKTITSVKIELETFPAQLCSAYTPSDMCVSEYFVKGTEPTETSKRFALLDNPTNGSYTYSGNTITIKWDAIKTPDAINPAILSEHFNKYYGDYATKYYENRISYNNSNIGTLGYEIYLNNESNYVGFTNNNSFLYTVPSGGEYNFIIKSAYSIFKANRSAGLTINTKTVDANVNNMITDNTTTNNNPSNTTSNDTGLN